MGAWHVEGRVMRKSHNRARIAARAAQITPSSDHGTVGTNPGHRVQTIVPPTGVVRRTRCAPMTAMQKDSTGKRSAWAASPYYFTDPAWSRTVSHPVR